MHESHQSRTSLVRRIVASAVAAAALSTPVIVELASHAHAAPAHGTHAVAMPDCTYNWAPICDRW